MARFGPLDTVLTFARALAATDGLPVIFDETITRGTVCVVWRGCTGLVPGVYVHPDAGNQALGARPFSTQ